jgi:hypothetical protein
MTYPYLTPPCNGSSLPFCNCDYCEYEIVDYICTWQSKSFIFQLLTAISLCTLQSRVIMRWWQVSQTRLLGSSSIASGAEELAAFLSRLDGDKPFLSICAPQLAQQGFSVTSLMGMSDTLLETSLREASVVVGQRVRIGQALARHRSQCEPEGSAKL